MEEKISLLQRAKHRQMVADLNMIVGAEIYVSNEIACERFGSVAGHQYPACRFSGRVSENIHRVTLFGHGARSLFDKLDKVAEQKVVARRFNTNCRNILLYLDYLEGADLLNVKSEVRLFRPFAFDGSAGTHHCENVTDIHAFVAAHVDVKEIVLRVEVMVRFALSADYLVAGADRARLYIARAIKVVCTCKGHRPFGLDRNRHRRRQSGLGPGD